MERRFDNLQDFLDALEDILAKYEKYVKTNINKSDFEVKNQKPLWFKWWCGKYYGHCFKNNAESGTCLRCGAKVSPMILSPYNP